ncbi:MAG: T9SS type A sorting domain-containing protein, partial [Sphingobacteriales bacterium]
GDWLTGTDYTILNPPAGTELADFKNGFNIGFYPTFYLICPDKRVYHLGGSPLKGVWTGTTDSCATTNVGILEAGTSVAITPVPANGKVEFAFSLPVHENVQLTVTTADGRLIDKKIMRVASGETRIPYDVSTLPKGLYFFSFATDRREIITKKVVVQ